MAARIGKYCAVHCAAHQDGKQERSQTSDHDRPQTQLGSCPKKTISEDLEKVVKGMRVPYPRSSRQPSRR